MLTIGIDPGASGAFTLLDGDALLDIRDMPTLAIKVGKTTSRQMNIAEIIVILRLWAENGPVHVFCEDVGPTPGKGEATMFRFGVGFGILQGVIATLNLSVTYVHPAQWKRVTRTPRDKDGARKRACQIFPVWGGAFNRSKDDGRAESALIAHYGQRDLLGSAV
jgi:crossover junction endodeoxyribonuclease RuvC